MRVARPSDVGPEDSPLERHEAQSMTSTRRRPRGQRDTGHEVAASFSRYLSGKPPLKDQGSKARAAKRDGCVFRIAGQQSGTAGQQAGRCASGSPHRKRSPSGYSAPAVGVRRGGHDAAAGRVRVGILRLGRGARVDRAADGLVLAGKLSEAIVRILHLVHERQSAGVGVIVRPSTSRPKPWVTWFWSVSVIASPRLSSV